MNIPKIHMFPEVPKRLPPFPTRDDVEEYENKVGLFLDSLPEFVESVNALIDYKNSNWDVM